MREDDDLRPLIALCAAIPGLTSEQRGDGAARFIYAVTATRAVELSLAAEGYFFEGWDDADALSDAGPVVSTFVGTLGELDGLLRAWVS